MKAITQYGQVKVREKSEAGFAVDTTFVLFFLAVEFGRSFSGFAFDNIFLALTLLVVVVMPYFLSPAEKPNFRDWVAGRTLIAAVAVTLGWMLKQSFGVILPETFRFLPMTLLIVAAMLSCYIQFYSFLKLRLAK